MPARILYIEDNRDNRKLVSRILMASDYEFEIQEAENALLGIELAQTFYPDLILMDLSMPGMDGLTATKTIRGMESLKGVIIVALTANAMQGDREKTLEAGCDGYIQKPVDVDHLPEELMGYLRRHA